MARALSGLPEELGSIPSIHTGLQPSVIPVQGDPMPSSGLKRHQACIGFTDIYTHVLNTRSLVHYATLKAMDPFKNQGPIGQYRS